MLIQHRLTVEEFDALALLPENADKVLEFIGGEIVEVPSNPYSSSLASEVSYYFKHFLKHSDIQGHITGEAGGYWVSGERYAPDVAFISKAHQPELVHEGYNPNAPDLAVEIVSPTDSERKLRTKVTNYLAAGTLVWVIYPESKEVEVYAPGKPMQLFNADGILDGGHVLPGFKLAVKDIFPEK